MNPKQLNILLGAVVLIALASIAYMTWENKAQDQILNQQDPPTSNNIVPTNTNTDKSDNINLNQVPVDQTASWKTYINNRVGYQFEYPNSGLKLSIDETIKYPSNRQGDGKNDLVQFATINNSYGVKTYIEVKAKTIEDWIKDELSEAINHDIASYKKESLSGQTGYLGQGIAVTYVLFNNNVYEITSHTGVEPNFGTDPIYQHMLSTFKFTK